MRRLGVSAPPRMPISLPPPNPRAGSKFRQGPSLIGSNTHASPNGRPRSSPRPVAAGLLAPEPPWKPPSAQPLPREHPWGTPRGAHAASATTAATARDAEGRQHPLHRIIPLACCRARRILDVPSTCRQASLCKLALLMHTCAHTPRGLTCSPPLLPAPASRPTRRSGGPPPRFPPLRRNALLRRGALLALCLFRCRGRRRLEPASHSAAALQPSCLAPLLLLAR